VALGALAISTALALAACGSSSSSTPSSSAASSGGSSSASAVDTAAAQALIDPITGHPSAFPITQPLATKPTGKRIAFLDCGTPICGLFFTLAQPAAAQLGMKITSIKSGFAPDTVQQAFDTVIQDKYDGVFVPALPPALWKKGLEQLAAAKIPVVTSGVVGLDPAAVPVQQAGTVQATAAGQQMAAWVVAKHGADSNVVFYYTPELDFTNLIKDSFVAEMSKLCATCVVRSEKVPVATFGTSAPSLIVGDLQKNPDTKTAVFGIGEQTPGLPAALKTAGITIESVVNSPSPAELEGIQKGNFDVGLGLDLPVLTWTLIDSLARQTTGAQPDPGATADTPPVQLLVKADLAGDVSHGWTGYPDFAQRFGALWASAK
jgi:ribose transport system substrate-binding protein